MDRRELERHRTRLYAMKIFGLSEKATCLFGEIAKFLQLVNEKQLQAALAIQKVRKENGDPCPKLGQVLVEQGIIEDEELQTILEEQERFGSAITDDDDDTVSQIYRRAREIREVRADQ